MQMKRRTWMAFILCLLLVIASGLMAACNSGEADPDDEDLADILPEDNSVISSIDAKTVIQIGFDFGRDINGFPVAYESEMLDFALEIEGQDYYQFQLSIDGEPLSPHVLIRHKDGDLFTYYENDGTVLALEEDPVLGPHRSADIIPSDDDMGHGRPGAVDMDPNIYDGFYEGGFEGDVYNEDVPASSGEPSGIWEGDPVDVPAGDPDGEWQPEPEQPDGV